IISLALIIRNQSIHEKKLAAEFLSRAKSRFIAASQKDMQAPLNSLRSDLKSLAGHVASPISRQLINSLNQLVDEVGHNLGSINYFNKLEGGITQINIQPVKLSSLFTKLQREYDLQATKNLTRLTVRHANIEVFSDSLLLERMLRNLISNAIKFSPGGRVLVGCRYKQGRVVIQVLDNGCGIAAADQKRIFNEYRRVAENALAVEGSGIGLSIVKYLSTLLDHPIMLESSLGKGSVFSITLPRVATRKLPAHLSALALNRPQIALCIADATLKQYVKKRLLEWRYLVSDFNSLHEIHFNTSNVAGTKKVVISDLEMLMPHTLQPEFRQQLKNLSADLSAAAFLCDKSVTVPAILQKAGWLPLPLPLNSTQLITFLNYVSQQNSA
nr:HAMP domain-containing histidine kinase [Cellvibrionaceae bacterium]